MRTRHRHVAAALVAVVVAGAALLRAGATSTTVPAAGVTLTPIGPLRAGGVSLEPVGAASTGVTLGARTPRSPLCPFHVFFHEGAAGGWGGEGDGSSPRTLVISHVSLVDVTRGIALPDQNVVINGTRIVSLGPAASTRIPAGARVVNGAGRFLIPGLWDMHAHAVMFGPTSLDLYLAHGVTSIRDMGEERFADAKDWRDRIASGQLLGPRMRIASPVVENAGWLAAAKRMNDQAGTRWRLQERVGPASVEEAERWVDAIAAQGPDHIKVRNWPAPEVGRALVERARQRGLPVVAHGNEPFPRTGLATLEHGIWPPLTIDASDREALWRQLAASGVALVPTLVTRPIRLEPPDAVLARVNAGRIAGWKYVPPRAREGWRQQLLQLKQERPLDWTAIQRDDMRNVAEMHKAGMTLLAGTDIGVPLVVPGLSLHDELGQLVKVAGMTPLQALQAATLSPARVTGAADTLGTIEVGKLADLVLLDANPLLDIHHTTRIHAVVANGRLLDRAALDRLLSAAAGTASAPAAARP